MVTNRHRGGDFMSSVGDFFQIKRNLQQNILFSENNVAFW
jgi:hypothetical protein